MQSQQAQAQVPVGVLSLLAQHQQMGQLREQPGVPLPQALQLTQLTQAPARAQPLLAQQQRTGRQQAPA